NRALKVARAQSGYFVALALNLSDPLLGDARVRKAIAMAIDRAGLAEARLRGHGAVVSSIVPRWSWGYAKEATLPAHDPVAARGRLAEAGGTGRPVVVRAWPSLAAVARPIVRELELAGLRCELRLSDTATMLADVRKGAFELAVFAGINGPDPDAL